MGRSRWKVDKDNVFAIIEYLEKHFKNDAGVYMKITTDVDQLSKVIDSYMNQEDIAKMRASVRKAKSRGANWKNPDVNITLKPLAHKELSKFIENYNYDLDGNKKASLTMSDAIESVFKALNDSSEYTVKRVITRDFTNLDVS